MTDRTPVGTLEEEHQTIMKVVNALGMLAETLESGKQVDADMLRGAAAFMQVFADGCHHGKEDELLFPALERKGVPLTGCPLGALKAEHVKGRTLVANLEAITEDYVKSKPSASRRLIETIADIRKLYSNHIWKEEFLAFPLVARLLSPREQTELQDHFDRVEADIGQGVHDGYIRIADQLHERTRRVLATADN